MFGLEGQLEEWRKIRGEICEEVCTFGFDNDLGSFVQSYDSKYLDAALLQIPCVGFLPVSDPRVQGTIAAIEKHLLRDGFVMRYNTHEVDDALPAGEGAFLACSFWLADVYMLQGRSADAEKMFRRLLALRNDVGLLSEEYDPRAKRLVGNFPQAFSHVALVNCAYNLTREEKPVERRAQADYAPPAEVTMV
jgi:GH15 family glucan-1,4-alpha-glucosidase